MTGLVDMLEDGYGWMVEEVRVMCVMGWWGRMGIRRKRRGCMIYMHKKALQAFTTAL
jgi:hypothetical protein